MTFIALFRDPAVSLTTNQLVLSGDEVQPVNTAMEMAKQMAQQLEKTEGQLRIVKQRAYDEGFAAGKAAGLQAGRKEVAVTLTNIIKSAYRQRLALQGSVARLAMQVVRKIAGKIGASKVVASLAQTAASELLPGTSLKLWVHPSVEESVRTRLQAAYAIDSEKPLHIEIGTNETLNLFDCTLSTDSGHTIAGLDAQLKHLEMILGKKLASEVKA